MNTTIFENKKCPTCGELLSTKTLPVIESKIIPGSYLLGCANCTSTAMTAGSHIVKVPEERQDIEKEYTNALAQASIDKISKSNFGKTPGGMLLQGMLEGMRDNMNKQDVKEIKNTKVSETEKELINKLIEKGVVVYGDAKKFEKPTQAKPESSPTKEEENEYNTAYVVLDEEGDVVDEYSYDFNLSEKDNLNRIVNNMIEIYGEQTVAKEEVTLHKLEKVNIKFKKKISYELDM